MASLGRVESSLDDVVNVKSHESVGQTVEMESAPLEQPVRYRRDKDSINRDGSASLLPWEAEWRLVIADATRCSHLLAGLGTNHKNGRDPEPELEPSLAKNDGATDRRITVDVVDVFQICARPERHKKPNKRDGSARLFVL